MLVMLVLQSIYMNQIKELIYLELYQLIINTELYNTSITSIDADLIEDTIDPD
jgi:hypothetical protein